MSRAAHLQPARMLVPGICRMLTGLLLAFFLMALPLPARAELTFPPLSGRVVDSAHVLDWQTLVELDRKLAAQEAKASDQFVVATIPSLQGTSIEDFANRLFRHWKLGQAQENNGVLLLVAPAERKVRIEVGYGLEGILTDAVSGTIIRTAIVPAFRDGDMAGGIVKGADAILDILNLDPEEARRRARALVDGDESDDWVHFLILAIMILIFVFIIWRGGGLRGGGAAGPIVFMPGSGGRGGDSGGGGFSGGGGSSGGGGASGGW